MRARSSTGRVAGRPDTTAGSQPISIIGRPTSDPPRTASLTSESPAPVPDAETLPLFTKLFPLLPVNPCQHPGSLPFAPPAPSSEHNHARYDAENRIISVSTQGSNTAQYIYDAEGRRVGRYVPADPTPLIYYVYGIDGNVVSERNGTTYNWSQTYARFGGKLVALYNQAATAFYHQDHLGSTRLITTLVPGSPPTYSIYDSMASKRKRAKPRLGLLRRP
jgi:YD repeat-containing protein